MLGIKTGVYSAFFIVRCANYFLAVLKTFFGRAFGTLQGPPTYSITLSGIKQTHHNPPQQVSFDVNFK